MHMKTILPWLCALALLGAAAFFFSENRKLSTEVAALRAESAQAQALHAEVEQLKTSGTPEQAAEIAQLRKGNEELLRLRNEVRQLKDGNKVLAKQAQSEQARALAAQSQVATLSTNLQAVQYQSQLATAQATAAAAQNQLIACINNLRHIDGAKQQWALENRKDANALPVETDLAPYLKDGVPKCPAGGVYALNTVGVIPTCTLPGHILPH